jgi:phosphate transport system permease protein
VTTTANPPPTQKPAPAVPRVKTRAGDRIFSRSTQISGVLILVILAGVAVFLIQEALPTFTADPSEIDGGEGFLSYVWPLVFGTLAAAIIALIVATPLALGIALFISHYAPRKLATPLAYVVDLLAAVPSIVYGLWGAIVLVPHLDGLNKWLDEYLGWTYIFDKAGVGPARSLFTVGILLAIMILPIVTNVTREVFLQVPRMHEEAALALGATRWETIRMSVLPFARSGIITASMLGLGRALGETMAVATVLSPSFIISGHLLDPGGGTFAQNIASKFNEANEFGRDALIASGLVLFVITLLVNGAARYIIGRRKEYSGANA